MSQFLRLRNFLADDKAIDSYLKAFTIITFPAFLWTIFDSILLAPVSLWNANRLAWTFSLKYGYHLYYGVDAGPLYPRMYGPLLPLFYFPITFITSPTLAVLAASTLSALVYFLPVFWLLLREHRERPGTLLSGILSCYIFCLTTFQSGALNYVAFEIHADPPALGFGILACILIYLRKPSHVNWYYAGAGLFSIFSVLAKHVMLPLVVSLPLYVLLAEGWGHFRQYVARLIFSAIMIVAVVIMFINVNDLFYNLFTIPFDQIFYDSFTKRYLKALLLLIKQFPLSLLAMFFFIRPGYMLIKNKPLFRQWLTENSWALFVFVGVFMIPTSLLGLAKVNGDVNNLALCFYFLACGMALMLKEMLRSLLVYHVQIFRTACKLVLCVALTSFLFMYFNLISVFPIHLNMMLRNYSQMAYDFDRLHPGKVFFPDHTLSVLLAEGKFYHNCDGMMDRDFAGIPLTPEHRRQYLPDKLNYIAFSANYADRAAVFMKYFPEFSIITSLNGLPGWIVFKKPEDFQSWRKAHQAALKPLSNSSGFVMPLKKSVKAILNDKI